MQAWKFSWYSQFKPLILYNENIYKDIYGKQNYKGYLSSDDYNEIHIEV